MSDEGLLDRILLILSSDHGQEFLDHGYIGHGSGNLYNEILHIPLIVFGIEAQNRIDRRLVSQLDIAPTILHWYEISPPKSYRGQSLLSTNAAPYVISEGFPKQGPIYSIQTKKWKFIRMKTHSELYNLKEDSKETNNIIDQEKAIAKEFEAIINYHILWEKKIRRQRKIFNVKQKYVKKIIKA